MEIGDSDTDKYPHRIGNQIMKNSKWKMVIQILISILTALGTTLGVTSCMA